MIRLRTRTYERMLCAALVFTLVFGGADYDSPQYGAILRILAIIVIAVELPRLQFEQMAREQKILLALAGGLCLLTLLQLVPVPPAIWADMPGRSLARSVYASLGWQDRWRPMDLGPDDGVIGLLKMLLPIAGFLAVGRLTLDKRLLVIRVIVAAAAVSAALGVVQFASGGVLTMWDTAHLGTGVGFFVDRNHQSLFLEIAIVFAGLPGVFRRDSKGGGGVPLGGLPMVIAIWALLSFGVLATTSRTGIALLLPSIAGSLVISAKRRGNVRRTMAIAAAFVVVGVAISFTPVAQQIFARYSGVAEDMRYAIWINSWVLAKSALPLGVGFGGFVSSYLTVEPLEQVLTSFVNHAHNEYFEWLIEGGIPAMLLLAGALAVYGVEVARGLRAPSGGRRRPVILAAALGIALALMHSVDEFPLRTQSLAVLFGMMAAMLFSPPEPAPSRSRGSPRQRKWTVAAAVLALPAVGFALSTVLAVAALSRNDSGIAVQVAPWMADSWDALGQDRLVAHDSASAEAAGLRALAIRPLDGLALRTVAAARLMRASDGSAALRLFDLAGKLGWRDGTTQYVLADTAVARRDAQGAARHIDAIGRQYGTSPLFWMAVSRLMELPDGADALADRIATKANWRPQFLQDFPQKDGATPQQYETILTALQQRGIPASATETRVAVSMLLGGGYYTDVARLQGLTTHGSLVSDSGFDLTPVGPLSTQVTPNSWFSTGLPGASVAVQTPDRPWNGAGLVVNSRGIMPGAAFAQFLVLPPGNYRLTSQVASELAGSEHGVGWSFTCRSGKETSQPIPLPLSWVRQRDGWWQAVSNFEVTESCPGQILSFVLTEAANAEFAVAVDDVTIAAVAKPGKQHFGAGHD